METWWLWWWYSHYYIGYGYYCLLLNDIPHVCHRLVANIEMNSYNQFGYRITKCIAQLVAFMQNFVKLAPPVKPCILLGVTLFLVFMGKSSWVHSSTQGLSHHVVGEVSACWRWWLTADGLGDSIFILIYMLLSKDVTYASNVFGTYINVIIWKLCCFH